MSSALPFVPRPSRRRSLTTVVLAAAAVLGLAAPGQATAAGQEHVVGWGNGGNGTFGVGLDGAVAVPTPLLDLPEGITAAAVSASRTFVVTPSGVHGTGSANNGGLGLGPGAVVTVSAFTPVPGTDGVVEVAAGNDATLVRRADGTLAAFGPNANGAAGTTSPPGTAVTSATPVDGLPAGQAVAQVTAGSYASLARLEDGSVWQWGGLNRTTVGQAAATAGDTNVPVRIALPTGLRAVEIVSGATHSLALLDDGSVWAWGATNNSGQIGNGTTGTTPVAPVEVIPAPSAGQPRVVSVAAGTNRSFATLDDGTFRAWGSSANGALGLAQGNASAVHVPTAPNPNGLPNVPAYPALQRIVAGAVATYGIGTDGRVYTWGSNNQGQLGITSLVYAYPFTGAGGTSGQTATEIPQRLGQLKNVAWIATGVTGTRRLAQTDKTLSFVEANATGRRSNRFGSQSVGTLSASHTLSVVSDQDPSTVKRVWIQGADADDFLVLGTNTQGGIRALPVDLSAGGTLYVTLRFAPQELGERYATLVIEGEGETLYVPLDGYGTPLQPDITTVVGPVGPAGSAGVAGRDGVDGRPGPAGTIAFAASQRSVRVPRGLQARLDFVIVNGTDATLAPTRVRATVPTRLRATGTKSVRVASVASGRSRTASLRLRVGKRATLGTHRVRVTWTIGGRSVTRTVPVRVTR